MAYQSKTYSLSDEVIARLEAAKAQGVTPNQFILTAIAALDMQSAQGRVQAVPTPRKEVPTGTPRKQSKKQKVADELRASDPMAAERDDVDYGAHEELPSGGSVAVVGAARPVEKAEVEGGVKRHSFCSGVHPIPGCENCARMAEEFQKQGERKK